jgi:ketosteroid isomerase-like protein
LEPRGRAADTGRRDMSTSTSTTEQNKVTVKEFLEVFSTGDVDGILERLQDDATWWISGSLEGMSGTKSKEEMGALLGGVTTIYKGGALPLAPVSMVAEGDRVAVEAEGRAELTNGRVYEPKSAFVF